MKELNNSEFYTRKEASKFPDKGIYVFFEEGTPLYVGRSEGMKERVKQHGRRRSGHNSVTFAFLLAKEKAKNTKIDLSQSREDLEKDSEFKPLYDEMKKRVKKMQIKVVEVEDPVEQTFFEVYAALIADTALAAAHRGTAARDFDSETFLATLRCHDPNGELYDLTLTRGKVTLSSYEDDAIRAKVETWADTVPALA